MPIDPKNYRYDAPPPENLKPIVNAPNLKPELTEEQKAQRKALLQKMQTTLTKAPSKPVLDKKRLPYVLEEKHPAELLAEKTSQETLQETPQETPQETSQDVPEVSPLKNYRVTLSQALGIPEMKSINYGVIGAGQCGGRLAAMFSQFGYQVCAINTAQQDLTFLEIPEARKLFLPYALGGAGKDLYVGQQAAAENQPAIENLIKNSFVDIDQLLLCIGGGGGTGGGVVAPLLRAIRNVPDTAEIPIVLIYTLPSEDEGALTKSNAIKTLEKISTMVNDGIVTSLIIVDNAKIQTLYPSVSIKDFWQLANFDIANYFNMFNTVTKCATNYEALDPMDYANIMTAGGCIIYGKVDLPLEKEGDRYLISENSLATALIESTTDGILAEGFDLKTAINIGVLFTGSQSVLSQIPAINLSYAFSALQEHIGKDSTIYRGVYEDDQLQDKLSIYTLYAGLGLPTERLRNLKGQAEQAIEKLEAKKRVKLTMGTTPDAPQVSNVMEGMKHKNTAFGKMIYRRRPR